MKIITIKRDTLPEAWEEAVIECWNSGDLVQTQYDKEGDEPSTDVLAVIHVTRPMVEPRMHRAFPGGFNDLEKYRSEVLYGVHDHWVDPKAGKWEYTYHERLTAYSPPAYFGMGSTTIDQIEVCIKLLKECPHTRRAQAVTWKVWEDCSIKDPACLQRLWFRIQDGKLNMVAHMRSNDAFKAAFMNMYAFTELQAYVASRVGVEVGEYVHIADSFHIYGAYNGEFGGFLDTVKNREFADRVFETRDVVEFFIDGCNTLIAEDMPELIKKQVIERKKYLEGLI